MAETISQCAFDDLADQYDLLVDWPKRLAFEAPFFRKLFEKHNVRRVADVACGTGHHAAMFHSWGLEVEGVDISSTMLERCRKLHGENLGLKWVQRSMVEPSGGAELFNAVVCIGNSLALCGDLPTAARAVDSIVRSVRPGGIGVFQVFNLGSLEPGPTCWQKVRRHEVAGHPVVLLKGIHRGDRCGYIDVVEISLLDSDLQWRAKTATFLGLTKDEVLAALRQAGATILSVLGSFACDAFDPQKSGDLIVVWQRCDSGQPEPGAVLERFPIQ